MEGRKTVFEVIAGVAVVAAFLIAGWAAEAGQIASTQVARRGADDVTEGGHRGEHHRGVAAAPAADVKGGKGKALFEEKCAVCHDLDRSLSRTKSRSGWTATVKRMRQVNGCPITDKEAVEIINYLTKVRGPSGSKP